MKPLILLSLLCAVAINVPAHAQFFAAPTGPATLISPGGITSVIQNGSSGYTVVAPDGVTNVMSYGNGNYTVVSPRGVTSVTSNGSGGATAIGPDGITTVISNGSSGYTIIGPDGGGGEILPLGGGGLFLINR